MVQDQNGALSDATGRVSVTMGNPLELEDIGGLNGKNAKKNGGFSENIMGLTIAGDFPALDYG